MRPELDVAYSLWQQLPLGVNDLNHHEGVFGQPAAVGGRAGEDAVGADESLRLLDAVSALGGVRAGLSQRLHDELGCVPDVAAEADG
jgi:hypothetical protein